MTKQYFRAQLYDNTFSKYRVLRFINRDTNLSSSSVHKITAQYRKSKIKLLRVKERCSSTRASFHHDGPAPLEGVRPAIAPPTASVVRLVLLPCGLRGRIDHVWAEGDTYAHIRVVALERIDGALETRLSDVAPVTRNQTRGLWTNLSISEYV